MPSPDAETERAEHAILRQMDPLDRITALACAAIDSETGTLRQAETMAMITYVMAKHTSETDRHKLAALMIHLAFKLIRRWH
jgi:hypothetical protein